MISSVLRDVGSDASLPLTKKSFKRSAGFGQVRQARSSRAKTKSAADAGRVNGIAIRPTEDKGARRFAAAGTVPGSTDRTQPTSRVPDAPVSNFTLTLDGGHKGLLQNDTNLCKHTLHVSADIAGQNGKSANQNPILSTPCGKHHKRAHLSRARRANQGGGR